MVKITQKEDEKQEEESSSNLDQAQLLNLAKTNLNHRNFTLSRQYSLQLLSSATTHRSYRALATQFLTISDILSSNNNHYSTLQIDPLSTDHNLIRTQFKKLLFILNPIKPTSILAQEALNCVQEAYNCLKDPVKKAVHDTEIRNSMGCDTGDGNCDGGFWTFCPYCFYVYEYDKVYEGCSLRCQNKDCRRVFHGVCLTSLPKMELDKGHYFGCFGYFPMGFKNGIDGIDQMSKVQSWSPLVGNGMFPSNNDNNNDNDDSNKMKGGGFDDGTNFIEIVDESDDDECDVGVKGGSFEENVTSVERDKPRGVRRKSVAVNARRKRRNIVKHANATDNANGCGEGLFLGQEFVLENDHGVVGVRGGGNVDDLNEGDMAFFEGGDDIFVGLGSDE